MEWTDIRLTVAKADADNAEAVATMIAEGGIYIEDYSDIEQQVAEIAHVDLIEQELLDKIARSELIVFNRAEAVNNDAARQELHKLVRQASRKCDIAYEFADGSVAYDDIPDPLPFDINADIIDIPDDDFGIWYMDCQDEPQKYTGKTVKFLAQVCQTNRAGKNSFVPGRFAMTCCVQDIQFVGFPCSYDGYKALEQRAWVRVTAKVGYKFHNIYRGKGPVLTAISVEPAEKPLNDVVTFS